MNRCQFLGDILCRNGNTNSTSIALGWTTGALMMTYKFGAEGWQLVTVVPHSHNLLDELLRPVRKIPFDFYWKRPVEAGEVEL